MTRKVIDIYFKYPILIDIFIVIFVWFVSLYYQIIPFKLGTQDKLLDILSSLISTMISLSGFILAALTIIVTFKSSLKARGIEDSTNALELLFSSRHYIGIVKVFKDAITEFVMYSIISYVTWQSYNNLSLNDLNRVLLTVILIISLATFRSLFMLFNILSLENHQ